MNRYVALCIRGTLLAATILVAAGSRIRAQTVTGVLRDVSNGTPIEGATVELFTTEGQITARDLTDESGLYSLPVSSSGLFRLRFQRIGYRSGFSGAFTVAGRDTSVSFRMLPVAVTVAPVMITASTYTYLDNVGFSERKKTESGFFLDPLAVEKRATKARQTADLLDGIPGVTLLVGGGSWGLRVPVLTRQMGCDTGPRIYIDGNIMNPFGTMFDVNTINVIEIAAIEIYRSVSQIPLKFGGTDATCGVLVMWTKH